MKEIIPKDCNNTPCPYMTDGGDIGEKHTLIEHDDFLIEEYKNDNDYYRRLILKEDLNTI